MDDVRTGVYERVERSVGRGPMPLRGDGGPSRITVGDADDVHVRSDRAKSLKMELADVPRADKPGTETRAFPLTHVLVPPIRTTVEPSDDPISTTANGDEVAKDRLAGDGWGFIASSMRRASGSGVVAIAIVSVASCGRPSGSSPLGVAPPSRDAPMSAHSASVAGERVASSRRIPSGFFLVGKERLDALREDPRRAAGDRWRALVDNAEAALTASRGRSGAGLSAEGRRRSSAENLATVYLVTRDARFAEGAFAWFEALAKDDVRAQSYLTFGEHMRAAATVLRYCGDALSRERRIRIAEYLETWTDELWFHNRGTGWGLADPGNNYHYAFLEGTAYAAYALDAEARPSARRLLDLVRDKIERQDGVLAYLRKQGRGGDWHEGANYGERAKQRMFSAFAAIVTMGGPDYFASTPFADESVRYAVYQVQPGKQFLAPTGDLARYVGMDVTPFDREYVQLAGEFTTDDRVRALASWYLGEVTPTYLMKSLKSYGMLHRDVLLSAPAPSSLPADLPLGYRSPGTDWLHARSGWDAAATSLTVLAAPELTQSHAHVDTGSFVLWSGGWQAVDAASYGRSGGLNWGASAHNMIHVSGHQRASGKSRGLLRHADDGTSFYAQIDGSKVFTRRVNAGPYVPMLDEWTRELLFVRPGTLVVYDRVAPNALATDYSWRVHFANPPSFADGRWSSANELGAIAVTMVGGGPARIAEDADLPEGPASAWRLEVLPDDDRRFLARIDVAHGGSVPASKTEPVTGAGVQGLTWDDHVVVFSREPFGAPARLPFTYRVDGGKRHLHTLVDMDGSCDVDISRAGGSVVVRVSHGTQHRADQSGLVRFSD